VDERRDVIVIGASAGGIEALIQVVAALPANLPAAVFVVLHVSPYAPSRLPAILTREGALPAAHAEDGEPIVAGRIYVAPPDHHLLVRAGHVHLASGPKEEGSRPAANPLFRTAARTYGRRVAGVVLSGALADGTAGLLAIEQAGGLTIVQDPEDAAFPSMPLSAIRYVRVDHVLAAAGIGALVARLAGAGTGITADFTQKLADAPAEDAMGESDDARERGPASGFTCPECSGALWEEELGGFVQYRCRIDHVYSAEALLEAQVADADEVLTTSLTALEEAADLATRMETRATERGEPRMAGRYHRQAAELARRVRTVRQALSSAVGAGTLEYDLPRDTPRAGAPSPPA
jgi:two-component system, chemotaxis family, protein-glutamate methylesterase/glutaminase